MEPKRDNKLAWVRESVLDCPAEGKAAELRDLIAEDADILELFRGEASQGVRLQETMRWISALIVYLNHGEVDGAYGRAFAQKEHVDEEDLRLFKEQLLEDKERTLSLLRRGNQYTNPLRCAAILPAFCLAYKTGGGKPLRSIEIGCSAGLTLCWDRYRYDYGPLGTVGDPDSSVLLSYRLESTAPPAGGFSAERFAELVELDRFPEVAARVGIDIKPFDLDDSEQVLWLRAWSDSETLLRGGSDDSVFQRALKVRRDTPCSILKGSAVDLLETAVLEVPEGEFPCVFHSYFSQQLSADDGKRLFEVLSDLGRRRPLFEIALGGMNSSPRGSKLSVSYHHGGRVRRELLGYCGSAYNPGICMECVPPRDGASYFGL